MSGGQWTQARKAAVRAWGIEDNTCQLCHQEAGTLDHRFVCQQTRPSEGWHPPPQAAELARARIGEERLRILQIRGLLVMRLPAPPRFRQECFVWLREPVFEDLEGSTWYIDGSLLDGEWVDFRAAGFAVVVVAADGSLAGYGRGCPPEWCSTAAAAEAWALAFVLSANAFPPHIRTDCQALLSTAELGAQKAASASRPLARIWAAVANALDGDLNRLVREGLLVWMPAHQTVAAIGHRLLSNGHEMNAVDWRANRLADALAKQAAAERQAPSAVTRLLSSGKAAVKHAAALLGEVTHAANNCVIEVVLPSGERVQQLRRDSQPKPSGRPAGRQKPSAGVDPSSSSTGVAVRDEQSIVQGQVARGGMLEERPGARSKSGAAAAVGRRRRVEEEALVRRRVNEISSAARAHGAVQQPSAALRMEGVRQRVLARQTLLDGVQSGRDRNLSGRVL